MMISKNTNRLLDVLKVILLFFTVYSIHFTFMPITPRIIALVIVLLVFLLRPKYRIDMSSVFFLVACGLVVLYSYFLVSSLHVNSNYATLVPSSTLNFFIFVGVFPILSFDLFKDEMDFCKALFFANSIQSLIVLLSAFIPAARVYLQAIQEMQFSRYNYRIIGLGIAGSGGSVYLFCGFLAGTYMLMRKDKNEWWFLILYILNFLSITLVGRTGFYCACVLLAFAIVHLLRKRNIQCIKFILKAVVITVLLFFVLTMVMARFESNTKVLEYTFGRLNEIFAEGGAVQGLEIQNERFPDLGEALLTGTGVVRGYTTYGIRIWHDGGYAQRLASLGLFVGAFSYLSFFRYLWKQNRPNRKTTTYGIIILCMVIMLVIEYKEPFMYMMALPYTAVMIAMLSARNKNQT